MRSWKGLRSTYWEIPLGALASSRQKNAPLGALASSRQERICRQDGGAPRAKCRQDGGAPRGAPRISIIQPFFY